MSVVKGKGPARGAGRRWLQLAPGRTYSLFLLREFAKVFLVCVLFIMGLSFIVRTLQRLDSDRQDTFAQMLVMRVLEAPEIISRETLLASCMFASVYTMSILTRNREILALRSCGVSGYRIIAPLILAGAVISGGSLLFEDFVVVPSIPLRERYAAHIHGEQVRGNLADRHNLITFGEDNVVYRIDRYASRERAMYQVMAMKRNGDGSVVFRIDAEKAVWDNGSWCFLNGTVRWFNPDGSLSSESRFSELTTAIRDAPRYFARDVRQVQDMTLAEALKYIHLRRRMGLGYRNELVKYHRKIATSATYFFIILIGLSLGSMAFRNSLVMSFSLTLLTVLGFYFIMEIGYTFGSSGRIPPALGGWTGILVFAPAALYLLKTIRK